MAIPSALPRRAALQSIRLAALGGLLGVLLTTSCGAASPQVQAALAPVDWADDLRPVTAAEWTRERAAHLLERTGFGTLPIEVSHSLALDPRAVVAALIRPQGTDDPSVRVFERSGLPDTGIDPFPETRPLATDTAKARGTAIGVDVKPAGNRPLQPVVDKFFFWLRASATTHSTRTCNKSSRISEC